MMSLTGINHSYCLPQSITWSKIRISPNTVLFNTPTAYKNIYGYKSNVKKNKTYDAWRRHQGDINTLNVTDVAVHARKRRILNTVFTERSVRSAASFIIKHLDRWNELTVGDKDWSEPIDLTNWTDCLVFDILGDLCFGKSFDLKEPGQNPFKELPEAIMSYMKFWHPVRSYTFSDADFLPLLGVQVPFAGGLNYLLGKLTPRNIKLYYEFMESSVTQRIKVEKALQDAGQSTRKDMFHYLHQAQDPETGQPAYTRQELLSEAHLLIIAGSDTTSITLCGFFFYITHYPRVYSKLVKHIRCSFGSVEDIVEGPQLLSCQYLRACIDEAMRMTPAGPSELSRTILPGGLEVDGDFLPEGVNVGTAGWANGRNDENYGDSNIFRPERWIIDEAAGTTAAHVAHARSCFHPFSAGPGNCVGQNLAILELSLVIARTLYRMDVRLAPGYSVGEGSPKLGWGRRDPNQFQLGDAYVAIRHGPMLQFRIHQT
ncbi:MAG: hypothetical protein Q9181_003764 [Wetmoreana brouardii]